MQIVKKVRKKIYREKKYAKQKLVSENWTFRVSHELHYSPRGSAYGFVTTVLKPFLLKSFAINGCVFRKLCDVIYRRPQKKLSICRNNYLTVHDSGVDGRYSVDSRSHSVTFDKSSLSSTRKIRSSQKMI